MRNNPNSPLASAHATRHEKRGRRVKEATARIKINRLLETAGWRFFDDAHGAPNIRLESNATIKQADLDALGNDFERTGKGFIDFLLLDERGFPLIVLEAKAEDKNPLVGKEQARRYARAQNCRFVILSNGNMHYFWDLERGNPYVITSFPTPDSVTRYGKVQPNPQQFVDTGIDADYIVLTQRPGYQSEARWKNQAERSAYIQTNKLRFLRPYQL
jgi:type I restriction enzyme R subunit